MNGSEQAALRTRILKVTENGPVTEWVQRIADFARGAGFTRPSHIHWNQSPANVTFEIIQSMKSEGIAASLVAAVQESENRRRQELEFERR